MNRQNNGVVRLKSLKILLILLIPFRLQAQDVVFASDQEVSRFKSSEEDAYNKRNKYKPFKPQPIEVVRNHHLNYIKITSSERLSKQDVNDSNVEKMHQDINFLDPKKLTDETANRPNVLSYVNSKGTIATLFLDSKYDEFMWGEPGYWINLREGTDSHDYYLGLAQNYYIKLLDDGNSIWTNDSTLRIQGARVRLIEPFMHPVRAPKYEFIDNVSVEISISDLKRDSDKDGLTDIEEDKLMLNPLSNDTDGDGILDLLDHNPRFKSLTTNETLVYKAILDNFIADTVKIRAGKIINPKRPSLIHTLKPRTYLIVSDDPNLQRSDFDYGRFVIISKSEYEVFKSKYPVTLDETTVTPMFKVDKLADAFVVSAYQDLGGQKFLIKKLRNGFDVTEIETWIH